MTELETIKLELGLTGTAEDDYLTLKLADANNDILKYTNNNTDIDEDLTDSVARKLVIAYYNKRGLEGLGYYSEGGLTYTFKEKDDILKELFSYRLPYLVGLVDSTEEE